MSLNKKVSLISITHQMEIQRRNLMLICRLAVKSLTSKFVMTCIDEESGDLQNFFAIIEHILNHRLKPSVSWYGAMEIRSFWDFIKVACKNVPRNCISTVDGMVSPKTSSGKGRAWLRICLMEKKLSDYLRTAIFPPSILKYFYDEGAFILSEDASILPDTLLALNAIDFSFDIKGIYLDYTWCAAINFAPYLNYTESEDKDFELFINSHVSKESCSNNSETHLNLDEKKESDQLDILKSRCGTLIQQLNSCNEQKRYLDEMLRVRELQLDELRDKQIKSKIILENVQAEAAKDRMQFETIIFELQSQIHNLSESNKNLLKEFQSVAMKRFHTPSISQHNSNDQPIIMSSLIQNELAQNDDSFFIECNGEENENTSEFNCNIANELKSTELLEMDQNEKHESKKLIIPNDEITIEQTPF